ncbi:MAG: hypothetical protein UW82_C0013G0006 [candidate division WWE3 bacterium GW2011_GWC2_44_9]|uniref:Uncharacterized protein n=2 Tax=Katanobacteria TaxID=422282 RepID=A0A0G1NKH3_UNCKA|nr:MAG: hypothetical protein UW36_C0001G0072 [candidate division WWE3 bacterium GW2011_GWA2_44_16]KKT84684.1 MAG: hypothetical protein UW82_C0013G0006 [candidate division WWE3 bacterium GW2011_GWC2_44_9]
MFSYIVVDKVEAGRKAKIAVISQIGFLTSENEDNPLFPLETATTLSKQSRAGKLKPRLSTHPMLVTNQNFYQQILSFWFSPLTTHTVCNIKCHIAKS